MNCFKLTKDKTIDNLNDLIKHYRMAIQGTTLWGPTVFSPILDTMEMFMLKTSMHMMYHCLLILTDGIIHDLRETVDRIVRGASYPLSIIIVGIGDADFTAMETLDSDGDVLLVNGDGEVQRRDIC